MNVSFIPAGADFLKTLAEYLRENSAATSTPLSRYHILLPTRRAVRTLQKFLMPVNGEAAFLPRIDAIGDLDDDALTLHLPDLDARPVISETVRAGILIRLIQKQQNMPWQRAAAMADALAKLLDESILREVPLDQLEHLVPDDIAEHWQVSLVWLRMIMHRWPEILAERGEIDAATARQNLLNQYAQLWAKQKPDYPIIAAGSTGSLPATRRLLKSISELPCGEVILPALDVTLSDDAWETLPTQHPQHHLKNLIEYVGIARADVRPLCKHECDHGVLWQHVLLPAAATEDWRGKYRLIQKNETNSKYLQNLRSVTASNAEDEAQAIALIMLRAAAERQTAALITPDRRLAQRTAARLAREGIEVNDTAGSGLDQSLPGRWLRMLLQVLTHNCDAVSLLGLLKHPLSCFGTTRAACRTAARQMEKEFFRAEIPVQNLSTLLERGGDDLPLRSALEMLCIPQTQRGLKEWVNVLIRLGATLTTEPDSAPMILQEEAGDALWKLLGDLALHGEHFPTLELEDLTALLVQRMQNITLRPHDAHPDLHILGPLEARLHHYDVVVLGGLNEGAWPQSAPADPWLSRPMRRDMELALPEEMLALTAHDFYQLAAQRKVYLTRSSFAEGAPTLPSRWWQRLVAYLQACQLDKDILENRDLLSAARQLHAAENITPAAQPRPAPPTAQRPVRYSPSAIETLVRNPYEFYAKYILGLRVLPELGAEAAEKEQGNLLHHIFAQFTLEYPDRMPADGAAILDAKARTALTAQSLPRTLMEFWWQNWLTARRNFMQWQNAALAAGRRVVAVEHSLSHAFVLPSSEVTLHARIDRIDIDTAGNYIIVDYKRKKSDLSANKIIDLKKPQLTIEAWLLAECGLDGHPHRMIHNAEYWPLLEDQMIVPGAEKFADALARLPEALGEFLSSYMQNDKAFTARAPSNAFEDQMQYIRLSRRSEWQGRAA